MGGKEDGVAQYTQPAEDGDTKVSKSEALQKCQTCSRQGQLIREGKSIHWMGVGKADACSGRCSSSKFDALKQG